MNITSALDRWVEDRRGPRQPVDPRAAYASWWEEERDETGIQAATAVVLITNRECPFRCLMCDLWTHTLEGPVGSTNVPHQIRTALASLPPARQVKLYNAGSFFDPDAIPPDDDPDIAALVGHYDRVVVEAHPAFLRGPHGARALRFRDALAGRLEVAIGLETAHAPTLARLNKRMTVHSFARAARFLTDHDIDLRVFLLLRPPFMAEEESIAWACRSIDVAFDSGATVCSIIPTRGGNGALEAIGDAFEPPALRSLERVVEYGVGRKRGRVFADLWDIDRLSRCTCGPMRADRLRQVNRSQRLPPPVACANCGD
jgi:archaeosine synthase beta-subunit